MNDIHCMVTRSFCAVSVLHVEQKSKMAIITEISLWIDSNCLFRNTKLYIIYHCIWSFRNCVSLLFSAKHDNNVVAYSSVGISM